MRFGNIHSTAGDLLTSIHDEQCLGHVQLKTMYNHLPSELCLTLNRVRLSLLDQSSTSSISTPLLLQIVSCAYDRRPLISFSLSVVVDAWSCYSDHFVRSLRLTSSTPTTAAGSSSGPSPTPAPASSTTASVSFAQDLLSMAVQTPTSVPDGPAG